MSIVAEQSESYVENGPVEEQNERPCKNLEMGITLKTIFQASLGCNTDQVGYYSPVQSKG
ncbi:hypothetical protein CFIMG_003205RA [Ceratocystis fimbriata CBS 114723]|uniref:Uncharacterized protein n=1 Tax=Ceratocystis fimbriata CBS 114723 TaxID=1035309 RepID=A0A2C5XAU4_9PEZI|nr:hypothetical protein CFIMG_003205RA [Ceratocystis fimbriata CBS 114723]